MEHLQHAAILNVCQSSQCDYKHLHRGGKQRDAPIDTTQQHWDTQVECGIR